jgi:hypothetical protein
MLKCEHCSDSCRMACVSCGSCLCVGRPSKCASCGPCEKNDKRSIGHYIVARGSICIPCNSKTVNTKYRLGKYA